MEMKVPETNLFCATHRAYVDFICANNFDWTVHRIPEAIYGKGLCWNREAWLLGHNMGRALLLLRGCVIILY